MGRNENGGAECTAVGRPKCRSIWNYYALQIAKSPFEWNAHRPASSAADGRPSCDENRSFALVLEYFQGPLELRINLLFYTHCLCFYLHGHLYWAGQARRDSRRLRPESLGVLCAPVSSLASTQLLPRLPTRVRVRPAPHLRRGVQDEAAHGRKAHPGGDGGQPRLADALLRTGLGPLPEGGPPGRRGGLRSQGQRLKIKAYDIDSRVNNLRP